MDATAKDESGAFSSDTKNAIDEYQMRAVLPANMSVCLLQVMHVSRKILRGDMLIRTSFMDNALFVWAHIKSDIVASRSEQGHAET